MMKRCQCTLCENADYNPEDFFVDINDFDREHKNGVSGLMRVKDEQQTISASIDSCIDALDELIICYQKCSDDTPKIIEQKRQQYPDKIKVYFYAPHTFNSNLTTEEYDYAFNLPDDSIHLICNYYNYTQSKATYKYALKIDADQIYFTQRLKDICDAYRTDKRYKITFAETMAGQYCNRVSCGVSMGHFSLLKNRLTILFNRKSCFELYYSFLLKSIANTKLYVTMSGVNVSLKDGELGVPYNDQKNNMVFNFNGIDDHIIYLISKKFYYFPHRKHIVFLSHELNSLLEHFEIDRHPLLQAPFMWYHTRYYTDKGMKSATFNQMPYTEFRSFTLRAQRESRKFTIMNGKVRTMWFLYKYDRDYPDFRELKQTYRL